MEVGYAVSSPCAQATSVLIKQDEAASRHAYESVETNPSGPQSPSTRPATAPPTSQSYGKGPPLSVRMLCSDVTKHLDGVHRQKGGIGRQGFDEKQQTLRKFFSGGGGDA